MVLQIGAEKEGVIPCSAFKDIINAKCAVDGIISGSTGDRNPEHFSVGPDRAIGKANLLNAKIILVSANTDTAFDIYTVSGAPDTQDHGIEVACFVRPPRYHHVIWRNRCIEFYGVGSQTSEVRSLANGINTKTRAETIDIISTPTD